MDPRLTVPATWQEAGTDAEILACFPVMRQLRTHLIEADFPGLIRAQMAEGFRLASLSDASGKVASVAGFRISRNLYLGRHLYVDDLVTDEAQRGQGYGALMLARLRDLALAEGCSAIHLDSGVQRFAAHRFYITHGMHIASHHFLQLL